ncbi:MAG: 16S rRNA (guanine(527)-N(7))-methyltransferase RsmG [Armatimonadota bacterium]|nr:16S rRNA (guanine(527)-N(7))-methyltransferase RsmG [Armatimonadota bacterium]MDR5696748.1 16S rRNA (guanine(527)-N(7))-methyltransferase RsmG [Armatimonadota bacterium]
MTLEEGASALGLHLSAEQTARLDRHLRLLIEWNRRMNLVAHAPPERIVEDHFLDSLLLLVMARPAWGWRVADIGSGAGFAGLVWAAVRADLCVTLIEGRQKRAAFLERVLLETDIHNAQVVARRAEDLRGDPDHGAAYDMAAARAVARWARVVGLAVPLLRPGGTVFVALPPDATPPAAKIVQMPVPWAPGRMRRAATWRVP